MKEAAMKELAVSRHTRERESASIAAAAALQVTIYLLVGAEAVPLSCLEDAATATNTETIP